MTQDQILDLSRIIQRQRRRSVLLFGLMPLTLLVAAGVLIGRNDAWWIVLAVGALSLLPQLAVSWAQTFSRPYYAGGPITARESRPLLLALVTGSAGSVFVFGMLAWDYRANLILAIGFGAVAFWFFLVAAAQYGRAGDLRARYVVDADGYLDSAAMKAKVTWDQIVALKAVRVKGNVMLVLETTDPETNHAPRRKFTNASGLRGYVLNIGTIDRDPVDQLLAFAKYRPALIEALEPLASVRPTTDMEAAGRSKGFVAFTGIVGLLFKLAVLAFTLLVVVITILNPADFVQSALLLSPMLVYSVLICAEFWGTRFARAKPAPVDDVFR